jgi:hypothetical protein
MTLGERIEDALMPFFGSMAQRADVRRAMSNAVTQVCMEYLIEHRLPPFRVIDEPCRWAGAVSFAIVHETTEVPWPCLSCFEDPSCDASS